jgi:hypothetical protein
LNYPTYNQENYSMKELIEDYKRRLAGITILIDGFKSNGSEHDIRKEERLKTKASEYRTIIAELERFLLTDTANNAIRQMLELGLIKRVDKSLPEFIKCIPQQAQAQYDLTQQLHELRVAANKLGLYDAADFLRPKDE